MKIIHILSQIELTGAEVYALELAHEQIKMGHDVQIISDLLHRPFHGVFHSWPIHQSRGIHRFKLIKNLRNKILNEKIDIVHTHSRAGLRIAHWALRNQKHTALVSTIHGRQHLSFSKKIFDIYADKNIAICENIYDHLRSDLNISPNRLCLIRNLFQDIPAINSKNNLALWTCGPNKFPQTQEPPLPIKKLSILGRTSGPKGEQLRYFLFQIFPEILKQNQNIKIEIVCRPFARLGAEAEQKYQQLRHEFPNRIELREDIERYSDYLNKTDFVIAAGRVAVEALSSGKIVFALGESQWEGLVTNDNWNQSLKSNFGDIGYPEKQKGLNASKITQEILQALSAQPCPLEVVSQFQIEFSCVHVSAQIMRVYESALWKKRKIPWIPILMYHKVINHEYNSKHKIFIQKNQFEKHLQFFNRNGFQTLTFSDLSDFRQGRKPWKEFPKKPLIITFDDGYKNNLENAAPLLKKYHMKACIFLLADTSVRKNNWDQNEHEELFDLMTIEERKKISQLGFEIGSHGFCHQRISQMNRDQSWNEILKSKEALEIEFKKNIQVYAYTYGDTNFLAARMASQAGYEYAVNTDTGGMEIEDDPFQIFRVNIFPHDSESTLRKKTSSWYRRYYFYKRGK